MAAIAIGCSGEDAPGPMSPSPAAEAGSERSRILGPFLEAHWTLPIPAQGQPPAGFSKLDASLAPEDCGACHPQQLADWRTSLHADAFSPGFAGQLIEGANARPHALRACQKCHNPLEEQQPFGPGPDHLARPEHDAALRAAGLVCAGCHVRSHRRYGPPRRADLPPPTEALPHGGFEPRPEFEESRFCAPCHQFFDRKGVNGKPIQNTYAEWKASPHAARGETCQSCHMPDRRHLWRGIHDPEMVRNAVHVSWSGAELDEERLRAQLRLESRGVGHAFPTYVTPRVHLDVWQEDAAGGEIAGTRERATIGRKIDFSRGEEQMDTRVPPGGSFQLDYARPRRRGAATLVGRVTVDPDFHYRGVFQGYLPGRKDERARTLIAEALRRSQTSAYTLVELRRPLPEPLPAEAGQPGGAPPGG